MNEEAKSKVISVRLPYDLYEQFMQRILTSRLSLTEAVIVALQNEMQKSGSGALKSSTALSQAAVAAVKLLQTALMDCEALPAEEQTQAEIDADWVAGCAADRKKKGGRV